MHKLIQDHPGYSQIVGDRARVAAAEAKHRRRLADQTASYTNAMSTYTEQRERALLAGTELPDPPTPPGGDPSDARVFLDEQQRINAVETAYFTEHAPMLKRLLSQRASEVAAEAASHVAALTRLATEANELAEAVRTVGKAAGEDPAAFRREALDAVGMVRTGTTARGILLASEVTTSATYFGERRVTPPPALEDDFIEAADIDSDPASVAAYHQRRRGLEAAVTRPVPDGRR